MKYLFLICFYIFAQGFCYAQDDPYAVDWKNIDPLEVEPETTSANQDDNYDAEDYPSNARGLVNTGFVLSPVYSSSSGQSMFGADVMYYFRRTGEPPLSEPCYARTYFAAGKNGYVDLGGSFNNYWDSEDKNLFTNFSYQRRAAGYYQAFVYHPRFLGQYRASDFDLGVMFRTKITTYAYIGVKYDLSYNMMENKIPQSAFVDGGGVVGLNGGANSGIGIVFNNTPTEEVFSPKTNYVFDITNMFYSTLFGGKYNFGRHIISFKEYYRIYAQHLLVFDFYARFHSGNVPYRQLASVGEIFNAYSLDKYTGRHMMAIKGEYRLPLFPRTYLTGFIGTSYITNNFKKFRLNDNLPSYGGGVLFLLYSELNINARLDFASGRDGNGVWLGIGEGF